jgi:hypothetical protein
VSGPDLSPVKPYPGFEAAAATPVAGPRARPVIEPAEPRRWSTTVALSLPLLVDGELLETVTARRLTGRDIADLLLEDDQLTTLNARARALMTGLHPDVLEALAADDAEAVAAACRPFLPASLAAFEAQFAEDALTTPI